MTIKQFITRHKINGMPHEVVNTSGIYPRENNRCYEVRLSRGKSSVYAWLYIYVGMGITDMSLEDMLRHLIDEAEHYGCWDTYEQWNEQNDEGYYESLLGREVAEKWYQYCKDTYGKMQCILGDTLYTKLADMVQN